MCASIVGLFPYCNSTNVSIMYMIRPCHQVVIESLDLDGALIIDATKGSVITVKNLVSERWQPAGGVSVVRSFLCAWASGCPRFFRIVGVMLHL